MFLNLQYLNNLIYINLSDKFIFRVKFEIEILIPNLAIK